jgi:hypothetical protein
MDQMRIEDLILQFTTRFDATDDLFIAMNRLIENKLFAMFMEGNAVDQGFSTGACLWERARDMLRKEKIFRDLLNDIERQFDVHTGLVSYRMFDWSYKNGKCMGDYRVIVSIGGGKNMRFTDGNRASTLTLPHGAFMILSNAAEKLVERVSPPYCFRNPNPPVNSTPSTDTNEPAHVYFLMLDVSVKGAAEARAEQAAESLLAEIRGKKKGKTTGKK